MILKILLVIGVIAVVYFMFIKKKPISSKSEKKDTKLQPNDMIECASCGVYVEVDEAILSSGKYYCSQECVDKDK
ncbi:PP0621 family protein [Sulfurimonas microaerophilic]|uniref:PP0621 family protein n=1 Tax=Sulfurimonas microaerophilic TaxID=3058392 RepID=UPI0027155C3D|nr:PP0621 family protein [Sulfurimonas sp. hsl 1-7]